MKVISLHVPESYITALDLLVTQKIYPNRSEAIRFALHDLFIASGVWHRAFQKEIAS